MLGRIPPRARVLELGPASGYMTEVLAGKGCVVDAVELNPADAAKARKHCRTMVVGSLEDPETWTRLDGSYEFVLIADVLEHLRSADFTLEEVRRRLDPGGEVIVSLPNVAYWKMRLDLLRGRFEYTDTGILDRTHLRFYTMKTAPELFERAGYHVAEVIVPPAKRPRLRALKTWVKQTWPTVFALNVVYCLRVEHPPRVA